ncbi:MAG: hypothetical protein DRR42_12275 [Gammaproteobacteria bacterium]|nr:MAG: hypothetical protein DRR42_12275 [Gammaproteobacteria bacterium]
MKSSHEPAFSEHNGGRRSPLDPARVTIRLVERIQQGVKSAESEFVEQFSRSVFLMLLKRTDGDEFVAHECTQETLLISLVKIRAGEIRKPQLISAFVRQTAINTTANYYRKHNRFVALGKEQPEPSVWGTDAASDIDGAQVQRSLMELLRLLPVQRDRELLDRFYLRDQEKKEICNSLNLTSAHFDRVLFRAKKRARDVLRTNKTLEALLYQRISQKD